MLVMRWIRFRQHLREEHERINTEIISLTRKLYVMGLEWLRLMLMIRKVLSFIRNKELYKPHLLIQLMRGYR